MVSGMDAVVGGVGMVNWMEVEVEIEILEQKAGARPGTKAARKRPGKGWMEGWIYTCAP